MTREEQEEFRQDLLSDQAAEAHERMEEARHAYRMHHCEDYFYDDTQEVRQVAIDAINDLKLVHAMYEVDFYIKDLEDEL